MYLSSYVDDRAGDETGEGGDFNRAIEARRIHLRIGYRITLPET